VDYPIVLSRPDAVGNRYRVVASARSLSKSRIRVGTQNVPPTEEALELSLTYEARVAQVDARGMATRLEVVLGTSRGLRNGAPVPLPPEGTRVEVFREQEKTRFTVGGRPLPEEVAGALDKVVSLPSGETRDDDVFGTSRRVAVGERWPMNTARMARELVSETGIRMDPSDLTGDVRLVGIMEDQGRPCLDIAGEARIGRIKAIPGMESMPGMKLMKGEFRLTFGGLFPTDPARSRQRQSMAMYGEFVMSGKAGPPGQEQPTEVFITMSERSEEAVTALEPAK
jgi:hypothetical protein